MKITLTQFFTGWSDLCHHSGLPINWVSNQPQRRICLCPFGCHSNCGLFERGPVYFQALFAHFWLPFASHLSFILAFAFLLSINGPWNIFHYLHVFLEKLNNEAGTHTITLIQHMCNFLTKATKCERLLKLTHHFSAGAKAKAHMCMCVCLFSNPINRSQRPTSSNELKVWKKPKKCHHFHFSANFKVTWQKIRIKIFFGNGGNEQIGITYVFLLLSI